MGHIDIRSARRRRIAAGIAAGLVVGSAGCGSVAPSGPSRPAHAAPSPKPICTAVAGLACADNAFAAALWEKLPRSGNLIVSPVSIATDLQLAAAGARGTTAAQLARALHLPTVAPESLGPQLATLTQRLAPLATNGHATVTVADAVWRQVGLRLAAPYAALARGDLGAAVRTVDFRNPEAARHAINSNVAVATRDRIRDLLPLGTVTPDTRIVLTNAVYLKARWAVPFDPAETTPGPFHAPGGTVTTPMMSRTDSLAYRQGPGYQAVQLPYDGGRLAMTVLLPDGPLAPLELRLSRRGLPALLAGLRPAEVDLSLPSYRFTVAANLNDALQRMGVTNAFSGAADFSGLTEDEPLQISRVQHKAFVAVDEKGTEAAAATAVVMKALSAVVQPPAVPVVVNRPFLFVITDTATGLPLFLGRVDDPTSRD